MSPGWGKRDNSYLSLLPPGPSTGLVLERWRDRDSKERPPELQADEATGLTLPGEEKGRRFELVVITAKLT